MSGISIHSSTCHFKTIPSTDTAAPWSASAPGPMSTSNLTPVVIQHHARDDRDHSQRQKDQAADQIHMEGAQQDGSRGHLLCGCLRRPAATRFHPFLWQIGLHCSQPVLQLQARVAPLNTPPY